MTTLVPVDKICAVCGASSQQIELGSTNSFGSADLDTRPPEMMRSTMQTWVERCPSCGYCAGNIAELEPGAREIMQSEAYHDQINDPDLPELANSFLCWALIQEGARQFARSGWNNIHAAWVCDDTHNDEGAQRCRKQAIDLLAQAQQAVARQAGVGDAVLVDLLRRSGQFERALSLCEDAMLRNVSEQVIDAVLRFQKVLIEKRDVGCYTIAQALGNA